MDEIEEKIIELLLLADIPITDVNVRGVQSYLGLLVAVKGITNFNEKFKIKKKRKKYG